MITTKFARSVGDIDILTVEVLIIRVTVIHARKNAFFKIIIESDSFPTNQVINRIPSLRI